MTTTSWDAQWEEVFRSRKWGRYPPEELVRFIATHFKDTRSPPATILELGCGGGANTWFMARQGAGKRQDVIQSEESVAPDRGMASASPA